MPLSNSNVVGSLLPFLPWSSSQCALWNDRHSCVKRASVKTYLWEPPVPGPGGIQGTRASHRLTALVPCLCPDVWQWPWERSARPLLMWICHLRKVCFGPWRFAVVRHIRQHNHGASWHLQTGKSRWSWWVIEGSETKSWQRQGRFIGEVEYFIGIWMWGFWYF